MQDSNREKDRTISPFMPLAWPPTFILPFAEIVNWNDDGEAENLAPKERSKTKKWTKIKTENGPRNIANE